MMLGGEKGKGVEKLRKKHDKIIKEKNERN